MTTTVKRGAGRPAANAKTTRHAQRTALPAKGAHADRVHGQAAIDKVETTTRSRRKAVTGSEESPNPTRPARTSNENPDIARRNAGRATKAVAAKQAAKQAETAPEGAPTPVAKRSAGTRKGGAATAAKSLPEDFPGRSKVMRLLDGPAQEAGWVGHVVSADPKTGAVEVSITKGDETMTWFGVDGKQDPAQAPRYSSAGRTVLMKNISGILAQATGEKVTVRPATERKARRASSPRAGSDVPQKSLPFDPKTADDKEIVSALRGKTVTWQNRISKAIDSAVIATRAKIQVEEHPKTGGRMVTFNDPTNTGTRTVLLENLLSVKG